MKTRLIMFVRAPRLGQVKTRLAPAIGATAAVAAYIALVRQLLTNLQSLAQVELRFTPDDADAEISSWLRSGWHSCKQGGGDLGTRLDHAFQEAFESGCERVAIIGSDCPAVEPQDIDGAWAALANHDVVLGPAKDGGFWLVGLRKSWPDLFQGIPWSTAAVWETIISRIQAMGLRVHCLRMLADIDTVQDWQSYLAEQKSVA
jgi:rSAM/selenodomain-associated transferase 1